VLQQRTETSTQAQYSNCNMQLNHDTNMMPITSTHVLHCHDARCSQSLGRHRWV